MAELRIEAYCGGMFHTNGYLVLAGDRTYLFDAPEGVVSWVIDQGRWLDGLILTHQHHDHVIDAGKAQQTFGCPIWAHSPPSDDLTMVNQLASSFGITLRLDPYSVDHLIPNLAYLELRNLSLEVIHVPGHSPDSLCYRIGENPVLIGGDVLFQNSIGRTDFPHGNHELLLTGIKEKLWPLPDETAVLPGHGAPTTIGQEKATNPFLR